MTQYVLPYLPYDYGALEPAITGEILELHHSKHHAAYVKGANDTIERLAETREKEDCSGLVGLEKTFAFNLSGHVLHTVFWDNLSPDGGDQPDGELGRRDRRALRLVRRVLQTALRRHLHGAGLGLGRARLGTLGAAAGRGADLRPPRQHRHEHHPGAGVRRVGTRLLPAVPVPAENLIHAGDMGSTETRARMQS